MPGDYIPLPRVTTNGKMLPFPTGQCSNGWHEGKRPRVNGQPVQVCLYTEHCPCDCHAKITKGFKDFDEPRELGYNPDYSPTIVWVPEFGVDYGTMPDGSVKDGYGKIVQGPPTVIATGEPGAVNVPVFQPTESGRTAKGQLEAWVKEVTDEWVIKPTPGTHCTPQFISREIARVQRVPEPSPGAVWACLERWDRYGYASLGSQPRRFLEVTDLGKQRGLDVLRALAKRS